MIDRYFAGLDGAFWIGANDLTSEGTFVWDSGAPFTFTSFLPGEPNNSNVEFGENCLHGSSGNGLSDDATCNAMQSPGPIRAIIAFP